MTVGKESFSYFFSIIDADYGIGFEVRKLLPETDVYHVNIDLGRGYHTCDCKGGAKHGHCKHQEALLALIQSGKLAVPSVASKPEPQPAKVCFECGRPSEGFYCDNGRCGSI